MIFKIFLIYVEKRREMLIAASMETDFTVVHGLIISGYISVVIILYYVILYSSLSYSNLTFLKSLCYECANIGLFDFSRLCLFRS